MNTNVTAAQQYSKMTYSPSQTAEQSLPKSLIYLDHHATTPLAREVFEAMQPYWLECVGNAASTSHRAGLRAAQVVQQCRALIAECLHCEPQEIVFTSGATESNNLAIAGTLAVAPAERREFVLNAGEHRAVLDPAQRLKSCGMPVHVLPITNAGFVSPQVVAEAMTNRTALVSVMHANNEVGSINQISMIGDICREHEVRFHVDASQSLGKIPLDLGELPVDLLSATAHKLSGPMGIGLLFVRRDCRFPPLRPMLEGGGHEGGLRSGTLPVPLIVGFARAVELATRELVDEAVRLTELRERLWGLLQGRIPGIVRNSPVENCLPQNLNVQIPQTDGEVLLARLRLSPLCVSSGSACTSANSAPSHVLRAMGLSDSAARASLRFGLGRTTTVNEIDAAVQILAEILGV